MFLRSPKSSPGRIALLALAGLFVMPDDGRAQPVPDMGDGPGVSADQIADIFSKVGDQIYQDCIFELSQEQIDVQTALIQAYIDQGASGVVARRLAVKQIQPPKLSEKCEQVRRAPPQPQLPEVPEAAPIAPWDTKLSVPKQPKQPKQQEAKLPVVKQPPSPKSLPTPVVLAGRKGLPQWDCAPGVDYVTIKLNGYDRKLTGGEICNPYQDVVKQVPASLRGFKLGYTIKTGRLFVINDGGEGHGMTIAWGLSGRDVCRNNPDPDCFAARAVGPLPPGEYSFGGDASSRVTWGPKTKRNVAGIYLRKLWNRERFSAAHTAAILKRGNIAIHVRLKGEMSEACIGLEPSGWAYVASLIKSNRATSLNVYIDEPYPQVAEAPPVVVASAFSLTSLFK